LEKRVEPISHCLAIQRFSSSAGSRAHDGKHGRCHLIARGVATLENSQHRTNRTGTNHKHACEERQGAQQVLRLTAPGGAQAEDGVAHVGQFAGYHENTAD
jgi:hypothetical protein